MTITLEKAAPAWGKFTIPGWQSCREKPVIRYEDLPPVVVEPLTDQFLRELQIVVREAGEQYRSPKRRYQGCEMNLYVFQVRGDCLVGRVLIRMGVPVSFFADKEGMNAGTVIEQAIHEGYLKPSSKGDQQTLEKMALMAQHANDVQMEWGRILPAVQMVPRFI